MGVERFEANPLIRPGDIAPTRPDVEVFCTINPGAVRVDGEALLLVRVGERPIPTANHISTLVYDHDTGETVIRRLRLDDPDLTTQDGRAFSYRGKTLLTSLSHLRVARSDDLVHWRIDDAPAIRPTTPWEAYGCEDARIAAIDGRYWITYTAVGPLGVNVMLAVTDDFAAFDKLGIVATTFNKDVCLLPEKVRGRYVCRHRPFRTEFNDACIWTAFSPDLLHWGDHAVLHRPVAGTWESERVGAGGTPIRTDAGWLEIYHAADANGRYALGAMLTDLDHPDRLLTRSRRPILEPVEPYERQGIFSECIFSNGVLADDAGGLIIFYGGADTVTAAARTTVDEMIAAARNE